MWTGAKDDHVVCVVESTGAVRDRFTVVYTAAGLTALVRRLHALGCHEVAIERPDGPVIDALLEAEATVVVISPSQLKNLRSRYGDAGNKDDRFDATCSLTRSAPTAPGCAGCCPTGL